jgi:hypothetical protein
MFPDFDCTSRDVFDLTRKFADFTASSMLWSAWFKSISGVVLVMISLCFCIEGIIFDFGCSFLPRRMMLFD